MSVLQIISIWFLELSLLVIGLVWGFKSARGFAPSSLVPNRQRLHAVEISRVRDEYKAYRDEVAHQFTDINSAVRGLNTAYGALFHHMADGSKRLVKTGESQEFVLSADQEFMATVRGLARQLDEQKAESAGTEPRIKVGAAVD